MINSYAVSSWNGITAQTGTGFAGAPAGFLPDMPVGGLSDHTLFSDEAEELAMSDCSSSFLLFAEQQMMVNRLNALSQMLSAFLASSAVSSAANACPEINTGNAMAGYTAPAMTHQVSESEETVPMGSSQGSDADNVAEGIAKEMAGYKWQYYLDDKKSNSQTIHDRSGNCCDLADVAIMRFKAKGIEARKVLGDIKSKSYNGGHYWVEYKDSKTGKWKFFDPTASATNHDASRAFSGLHATYRKR